MVTFKLVVSDKSGKARTFEVKDTNAQPLVGLRIGDTLDASIIGLQGKLKITGGSDKSGIPMRYDIHGAVKKYILTTAGVGLRKAKEGERRRKLVRGNVISDEIYEINTVLVEGSLPEKVEA